MKIKQFFLLAALAVSASATLTSCEDILGHWDRPSAETPGTAPTPASYVMVADATEADKGKLICTDGHIHANGADAECTKDRVAMIVYVGSGGETDATYKHGLAIALTDVTGTVKWGTFGSNTSLDDKNTLSLAIADMAGIANTATLKDLGSDYAAANAAAAYAVAAPAGTSGWFLPSAGQWYKFLNGMCGLTWGTSFGYATGTASDNYDAANKAFGDAGYDSAKFGTGTYYWSSSECAVGFAVVVGFSSSDGVLVYGGGKDGGSRVRSFLAF